MLIPISLLTARVLTTHLTCTQTITFQITLVPKEIWARRPSIKTVTLLDSGGSSFKTKQVAHKLKANIKGTRLSMQARLGVASSEINLSTIENKTTAEFWVTGRQSDTTKTIWISTPPAMGSHTGCMGDKLYLRKISRIHLIYNSHQILNTIPTEE